MSNLMPYERARFERRINRLIIMAVALVVWLLFLGVGLLTVLAVQAL